MIKKPQPKFGVDWKLDQSGAFSIGDIVKFKAVSDGTRLEVLPLGDPPSSVAYLIDLIHLRVVVRGEMCHYDAGHEDWWNESQVELADE